MCEVKIVCVMVMVFVVVRHACKLRSVFILYGLFVGNNGFEKTWTYRMHLLPVACIALTKKPLQKAKVLAR